MTAEGQPAGPAGRSRPTEVATVLARQFLLVAGFIARPETFFKPSIVGAC
jgi:hypothetical protein